MNKEVQQLARLIGQIIARDWLDSKQKPRRADRPDRNLGTIDAPAEIKDASQQRLS